MSAGSAASDATSAAAGAAAASLALAPKTMDRHVRLVWQDDDRIQAACTFQTERPAFEEVCQAVATSMGCEWEDVSLFDEESKLPVFDVRLPEAAKPRRFRFRLSALALPRLDMHPYSRHQAVQFAHRLFAEIDAVEAVPPLSLKSRLCRLPKRCPNLPERCSWQCPHEPLCRRQ